MGKIGVRSCLFLAGKMEFPFTGAVIRGKPIRGKISIKQ